MPAKTRGESYGNNPSQDPIRTAWDDIADFGKFDIAPPEPDESELPEPPDTPDTPSESPYDEELDGPDDKEPWNEETPGLDMPDEPEPTEIEDPEPWDGEQPPEPYLPPNY